MLTIEKTNDLLLINNLDKICFSNQWYSINTYENMVKNHELYLIKKQGENVGFLIVLILGKEIEIIKIGIVEKQRRKGFAFQALNIFLNAYDYEKCYLEVSNKNTNAIKLYLKLGFKKTNIRKRYYQDGSDALNFIYIKS